MKYSEAKKYLKKGMRVRIECDCVKGEEGKMMADINGLYPSFPSYGGHYPEGNHLEECEIKILTNPDGSKWVHPDQKFKVGDRVKVIGGPGFEWWARHKDALGYIGYINSKGPSFILDDNRFGINFQPEWLEKVEEPKTTREQIVRIIDKAPKYYSVPKDFYRDSMWDMDWGLDNGSIIQFKSTNGNKPKGKTFMSSAVDFVKKQALKATNPEEYELREAGLHNECGELTNEGEELRDQFLEELVKDKLVETAKAINADKKEKK